MNSIKSLDGNDVFEMALVYQKMYENALDDYIDEIVIPVIDTLDYNNSFKDFIVLWNKIVASSDA
jgi:hypothetical protein